MSKPVQHREYIQHAIEVLKHTAAHPHTEFEAEACAHAARELEDQLVVERVGCPALRLYCTTVSAKPAADFDFYRDIYGVSDPPSGHSDPY